MDTVVIVAGFSSLFSKRVRALAFGTPLEGASKSDLQEVGKTLRALSNDAGGKMLVESLRYQQGVWVRNLELTFSTAEARQAEVTIEDQKKALDAISHSDYSRVLVMFERSAKSKSDVHKPTGELVIIEEINEKPKALIYASEMAEQIIKREIIEADDNIFKKGFIVDADAKTREGRIIAYAVTAVHQVIDIPDE